jgi:hypothetical protein
MGDNMKVLLTVALTLLISSCLAVTVSAQTKGTVTANRVNVRDNGCLNQSNVLYQVNSGEPVEIWGTMGDFYKVSVKQDKDAYIAKEFVRITEINAEVNKICHLYDKPAEWDGGPVGMLLPGETVAVESFYNGWFKVSGGYVLDQYLTVADGFLVPEKRHTYAISGKAEEIIEYAKAYLGVKYIYGSMNPNRGFDCSGYINYVLSHFDISVNRNSAAMANNGTAVNRDELIQGDLVFFATGRGRGITHVGMYIGGGRFIHSSSWRGRVVIDCIREGYYSERYVKAVRVL